MVRPVVLLDLDGTLLDDAGLPGAVAGTCRALAALRAELDVASLVAANTVMWDAAWHEFGQDWITGRTDGALLGTEAWRRTLAEFAIDDVSLTEFAQRTHADLVAESEVAFPDVLDTLTALDDAGIPFGLITNGAAATQRGKIRRLGLEDRFAVTVVSAEVGVMKPDPAIFEFALDALGAAPEDAWHVGDSAISDVAGANSAGVRSVWLDREGADADVPAAHRILSLEELMPLLRAHA